MKPGEVAITVKSVQGMPCVCIQGTVGSWHVRSVEDVIESFVIQETPALSVDLTRATFPDVEGMSSLIRTLRIASSEMRMSVLTGNNTSEILRRANLGDKIDIRTPDEAGQDTALAMPEYYTSRWMPDKVRERELPLAA